MEIFETYTHHAWNLLCKVSPERNWFCPKPKYRSRSSDPKKNWHLCSKAQDLAFIIMKARPEWRNQLTATRTYFCYYHVTVARAACRLPAAPQAGEQHRSGAERDPRGKPRPAPPPRSPGRAADSARHCGALWRRPATPSGQRDWGSPSLRDFRRGTLQRQPWHNKAPFQLLQVHRAPAYTGKAITSRSPVYKQVSLCNNARTLSGNVPPRLNLTFLKLHNTGTPGS